MGDKMTNFRAEDMPGAVKVAFTKTSQPQGDPETEQVRVQGENEVPKGTAKEVLKWAGDDPERIQRALDEENAAEDPRSSLVEDLERAQRRVSGEDGRREQADEPVHVEANDAAQAEERPHQ